MTSDSEFVAFGNHAIQLALDLMAHPNIWAVLLILLEIQDVNTSYVQVMHDYYNECYNTKTKEYMNKQQKDLKITCIILLLKEFQLIHSNECEIYECSQQINMMSCQC